MAKFSDLVTEASRLCDEEYDNAIWVAWFNDALDDLSDVLFISKRTTISGVGGLYPLPSDFKSIIRIDSTTKDIKQLEVGDDTSTGYRVLGDNLEIQGETPAEITLTYYRYPAHISLSNTGVDVDINERYVKAILAYACSQAMLREDEQERYEAFFAQYMQAKGVIAALNKKRMPVRAGTVGVVR